MFEIAPRNIFSSTFISRTPQQEPVELKMGKLRERADFQLQGMEYRLYREGAASGDFVIDRGGTILARAQKPSAFRETLILDVSGQRLEMRRAGTFTRRFLIMSEEKQVGAIEPLGAMRRAARVDLPADWPFPVMLFVFWLAALMWQRQEAAAS